jgi:tRNA pseudouridine13 synthase
VSTAPPDLSPQARPLLTAAIPQAGGLFKAVPEDFEVEELPAYVPGGEGTHLYLWVEKVGRDTMEVVRELARVTGVPEKEIGYAGLKDRHARTRQYISVPASAEAALERFELSGVQVLSITRHTNKLRSGHLRGNRFTLVVRDVGDVGALDAAFQQLVDLGLPNAFGDQRFGRHADNALMGWRLLMGERLPRRPDRFQRKLFLSALQSELFNRMLIERLQSGDFARALLGDVLRKEDSGGLFVSEDPLVDQPRLEAFEVSPTGPIFGPKMRAPTHEVAERERVLLAAVGLDPELFQRGRGETEGTRRPYRVRVADPELERLGDADVRLTFSLPSGSYATELLRELL